MKEAVQEVITQDQLESDFSDIGLQTGDVVNVHSSMKRIGKHVQGGPETVIHALLNVIGEHGTLVMPVFTNVEKTINLRTAPSRLGIITETFRTWSGVLRSNSATHSVAAFGAQAREIIDGHEQTSPLGVGSPLHKLAQMQGKVLQIGTILNTCSLLHVAESIANVPYQHIGYGDSAQPFAYISTDGNHYLQTREENPGDGNGFVRIGDLESVQACCQTGLIGNAQSYLYQADGLLQAALDVLAEDVSGLLCTSPKCRICNKRRTYLQEKNYI